MTHPQGDTRRILLIDQNPFKQNLRATILRKYEVEVHTAASAFEAEGLWATNAYDLILLAAMGNSAEEIAQRIRSVRPRQRIALLMGAPTYIREMGGILRRDVRTTPMPRRELEEVSIGPQWQAMVQRMISGLAS